MDTSAGVRPEASPELGAKGESGAVETKMQINPSCHGTVVLAVHFLCWVLHCFPVCVFMFTFALLWTSSTSVTDILILNMFSVTKKPL